MSGGQGSTMVPTAGYVWYDGDHRKSRPAALLECSAEPVLRNERRRWRELLLMRVVFEDLPQTQNRVSLDPADLNRPRVEHHGASDYTRLGEKDLESRISQLVSVLPVESIRLSPSASEAHIQCTTPMGRSSEDSVVDDNCVHHRCRNLVVLGSSVFPTASPANPTLTLCALSLRSADLL
jgi:choline dehydrogenase-like flavoprotein